MEIKMPIKSLRFLGTILSDTNVSMVVTLETDIIFNGTLTADKNSQVPLVMFETKMPPNFLKTIPMTVAVSNGTIVLTQILVNQQLVTNKRYNEFQLANLKFAETTEEKLEIISQVAAPPFSQEQLEFLRSQNPADWKEQEQLLIDHQCNLIINDPNVWTTYSNGDPRENVRLNGILQIPQRRPGQTGTWNWTIESGNILSYDLKYAY
jgi:hypothetical protein